MADIGKLTEKWLSGAEARVRDRSKQQFVMPPWDEMTYFQPVKETTFSVASGTPQLVAQLDPMRVAILFSASGTGGCTLSTLGTVQIDQGMRLLTDDKPIILLQSQVGNLVQAEWHCAFQATTKLTVFEIRLRAFGE